VPRPDINLDDADGRSGRPWHRDRAGIKGRLDGAGPQFNGFDGVDCLATNAAEAAGFGDAPQRGEQPLVAEVERGPDGRRANMIAAARTTNIHNGLLTKTSGPYARDPPRTCPPPPVA
jgi:hypothetical protein